MTGRLMTNGCPTCHQDALASQDGAKSGALWAVLSVLGVLERMN